MAHPSTPLSRGEMVLAELKLLASIPAMPYASFPNVTSPHKAHPFSSNVDTKTDRLDRLERSAPSDPVAVKFPRSRRTLSTNKGRSNKASPGYGSNSGSGSETNDENVHPTSPNAPKTPLAIARTVRRTISGGLSNILRPFQPNGTKEDLDSQAAMQPSGFRKIRRTVSNNILRAVKSEDHSRRPSLKKVNEGHRKSQSTTNSSKSSNSTKRSTTMTKANKSAPATTRTRSSRVRESVCSRNSTISIMEYLAERHRLQGEQDHIEGLVPLHEYGRNCHLFGCDSLHVWNTDPNSSCAIIHCDCEEEERSKDHAHIDEEPPQMPFFYKPGNSASTCIIPEDDHGFDLSSTQSSIIERHSMISVDSLASTEKQQYHQPPQALEFPEPPEPRYLQSLHSPPYSESRQQSQPTQSTQPHQEPQDNIISL